MPIFDYRCTQCNEQFEFLVLKEENPTCSNCGSLDVKKVYSGRIGIDFRGDGFYSTQDKSEAERKSSVW